MIAMIVFYFSSAPMMQRVIGFNPLTPERIAERRAAVLDFISAALFKTAAPKTERFKAERFKPDRSQPKRHATQGARS